MINSHRENGFDIDSGSYWNNGTFDVKLSLKWNTSRINEDTDNGKSHTHTHSRFNIFSQIF